MSPPREPRMQELLGSAEVFSAAVNGLLEAQIERAGLDIALSQVRMLTLLERAPGSGVSDVAEYMGVSRAAVSRAVDRLVRRGLLDRATAGDDRRAVDLTVTDAGREMLDRYQVTVREALGELMGALEPDRVDAAISLLDHLSLVMVQRYADVDEACFRCGVHFREKCVLRRVVGRKCLYLMALEDDPQGNGRAAKQGQETE